MYQTNNLVVDELRQAEWSRVFGPTNSLAGQMVQAERDLARQQQYADRRSVIIVEPDTSSSGGEELTGGQIAMLSIFLWPFLWVVVAGAVAEGLMWVGLPEGLSRHIGWWTLPSVTVGLPSAYLVWRTVSALRRLRARLTSRQD